MKIISLSILTIIGIVFLPTILNAQTDSVPDVVISKAHFERIVMVRLKNNVDLLEGIKKAVKDDSIKNGVILTGIGSITQYHVHSVKTTTFPTENIFLKEQGAFDILNIGGYVFNRRVHAHITMCDLKKTVGGHLESGTTVYTFAIITIGVLPDKTKLENFDNWRWR